MMHMLIGITLGVSLGIMVLLLILARRIMERITDVQDTFYDISDVILKELKKINKPRKSFFEEDTDEG